jgi:heme/copper-type cytochrome/quinol oxidase subunit 2
MTIRLALFWIAAACCVLAELAIVRAVVFGRAGGSDQSASGTARPNRHAEIAWAVLPAIGLLFVLYLTWRAVDAPRLPAANVTLGATIGA